MNAPRNAWAEARAEHDQVVADFLAAIDGIPAARWQQLPRILASHKFPRGAEAMAAIECAARERPSHRIVHAHFGPLSLSQGLRVLSAHTRHHSGGMEWRRGA